jgi:hypothetical protein
MKTKLLIFPAALFLIFLLRADAAQSQLPALDTPSDMTLFSTNPNPRAFRWWFSRRFYDDRIVGQVRVAAREEHKC